MSANKRGSGLDYYLESPLYGGSGKSRNPGMERERRIQWMLERNIAELALNRFKYDNLPDSADQRFIEKCMLFNGLVVWYWDDDYKKLLAVSGAGVGAYNFYENPLSFTTIGPGNQIILDGVAGDTFKPKQLSAYIPASDMDLPDDEKRRKAVGMYPNALRIPDIDIVQIYSTRLATTDRSLEINAKNARRNKVITSTPNTQLSMRNIARQQDMGVEAIEVTGAARPEDNITALDLGIDSTALSELSVLRTRWWNECMGLLGIDNANQDKKERLVESEVGANDAQTDSMRYVALNARRQALDYVNDIFDTNIKVDYNVEVEAQAKAIAEANGMADEVKPKTDDKAVK
jgi:hypothetical protein